MACTLMDLRTILRQALNHTLTYTVIHSPYPNTIIYTLIKFCRNIVLSQYSAYTTLITHCVVYVLGMFHKYFHMISKYRNRLEQTKLNTLWYRFRTAEPQLHNVFSFSNSLKNKHFGGCLKNRSMSIFNSSVLP